MSILSSRTTLLLNWYANPLRGETVFLRLDQLAGLGCCCFCSIQFIVPERKNVHYPELWEA